MKEKVSQQIDKEAIRISETVQAGVKSGKSLKAIADELGEKVLYEETGGLVDKLNVDGGRAGIAMGLEAGQTSDRVMSSSGDGYYFVTLINKTESQVNYTSIKIPFLEFNKQVKQIREGGLVREMISLKDE